MKARNGIRLVLLDLDGTLADTAPDLAAAAKLGVELAAWSGELST